MGLFARLFRSSTPSFNPQATVDTVRLDESLQLLKTTTLEVSEAAVNAAKVLQEQLQDSEFRFLSTVDSIDDLVIIKDGQGRWKMLNKWGQNLFNWHHGEYMGKTDEELSITYPAFKDCFIFCKTTDEVAWDEKRAYRAEQKVPSGPSHYHLDIVKTPVFNTDGSRKELIVIGRDVTEIHEKHKRTKACFNALNSASDIIFIIDNKQKIFFCNDMFVDVFDIEDYNDVVNKPILEVLPQINKFDVLWKTVKKNKTWEDTFGTEHKLTIIPMMNGAPEPIYYVCTLKPLRRKRINNL